MSSNAAIPLHSLRDRTDLGLEIHWLHGDKPVSAASFGVHRDDHYVFIFQQSGSNRMMIDFQEVKFEGCVVFCLLPGQVHDARGPFNGHGWFMASDLTSVDETYRSVFDDMLEHPEPVPLDEKSAERLHNTIQLLFEMINNKDNPPFQQAVLRSMVQVCTGSFAAIFQQHKQQHVHSRPVMITHLFRKLVFKNFKTVKSPSDYAGLLNISPSYLNEAVKATTGNPASFWIQREVMIEAKRLLCYTDLNIKEISFQIGYVDPTYFSRLFHKVTGSYPAAFRKEYRK
jgi:AraC family transcriptional activator of pobA